MVSTITYFNTNSSSLLFADAKPLQGVCTADDRSGFMSACPMIVVMGVVEDARWYFALLRRLVNWGGVGADVALLESSVGD